MGLSATLSDMEMVKETCAGRAPVLWTLEGGTSGGELKLQIRGYTEGRKTTIQMTMKKDGARQEWPSISFPLKGEPNLWFRRLTTERWNGMADA